MDVCREQEKGLEAVDRKSSRMNESCTVALAIYHFMPEQGYSSVRYKVTSLGRGLGIPTRNKTPASPIPTLG